MKVFSAGSELRSPLVGPKLLVSLATIALLAALLAVGGSASAATTGGSGAGVSASSSAAVTPATAVKYYLRQAGTGNKVLHAVALPSKWYLTWKFDCGSKKGYFLLTSTRKGAKAVTVARQGPGLGGGGQLPYKKAGSYRFAVKTACAWTVSASSVPPAA